MAPTSWLLNPRQAWYFAPLNEFDVNVRMMTTPFDDAGQLAEALTTAGFEAINTEAERHVVRIPDRETWWRWALSAGSRTHIEALDPPAPERFKRIAVERLRETYASEPIEIAANALFTVGGRMSARFAGRRIDGLDDVRRSRPTMQ